MNQPANVDTVSLLRTFAACHQMFLALADRIRSGGGVEKIVHETDLSSADGGFQFSEYVSPDRIDGHWTYWRLEVNVAADATVTIDADVLRTNAAGQNIVDVVARGLTGPLADAGRVIAEIAARLCQNSSEKYLDINLTKADDLKL